MAGDIVKAAARPVELHATQARTITIDQPRPSIDRAIIGTLAATATTLAIIVAAVNLGALIALIAGAVIGFVGLTAIARRHAAGIITANVHPWARR